VADSDSLRTHNGHNVTVGKDWKKVRLGVDFKHFAVAYTKDVSLSQVALIFCGHNAWHFLSKMYSYS